MLRTKRLVPLSIIDEYKLQIRYATVVYTFYAILKCFGSMVVCKYVLGTLFEKCAFLLHVRAGGIKQHIPPPPPTACLFSENMVVKSEVRNSFLLANLQCPIHVYIRVLPAPAG